MHKKTILLFLLITSIFSCKNELKDADIIVRKSIEVSGGDIISSSTIDFDFRDKHYKANRDAGLYKFERVFSVPNGNIKDILSNNGFKRFFNDEQRIIQDSMIPKYSASVNSVHYFSVLPYGLEGKAVNKSLLGKSKVKGEAYYKIKVTFNEDGGGEDFEDVFIYWINTETFKADYLAYSYEENHGLGLRFREAYNERYIKGIRFVDYNNYKPKGDNAVLETLDMQFENGKLELLSKIELENVLVTMLR
tara:strand:+ start:436 stop:1182 length:747 start_codon:yes stop_codon:yes gene_type:complete